MKLRYADDEGKIQFIQLDHENQVLSLGRSTGCHIHNDEPELAWTHALIIWNHNKLIVKLLPKEDSGLWIDELYYKSSENDYIDCQNSIRCGKLAINLVEDDDMGQENDDLVQQDETPANDETPENRNELQGSSSDAKDLVVALSDTLPPLVKSSSDKSDVDKNTLLSTDEKVKENEPAQVESNCISHVLNETQISQNVLQNAENGNITLIYNSGQNQFVFTEDNPIMTIGSRQDCSVVIKNALPIQTLVILRNNRLFVQDITRKSVIKQLSVNQDIPDIHDIHTMVDTWVLPPGIEMEVNCMFSSCNVPFIVKRVKSDSSQADEAQIVQENILNAQKPEPEPAKILEPAKLQKKEYIFHYLNDNNVEETAILSDLHPRLSIGRHSECHIRTSNGSTSRHHAIIELKGNCAYIKFPPGCVPTNGVKVDGIRLNSKMELEILNNSIIMCGEFQIRAECKNCTDELEQANANDSVIPISAPGVTNFQEIQNELTIDQPSLDIVNFDQQPGGNRWYKERMQINRRLNDSSDGNNPFARYGRPRR